MNRGFVIGLGVFTDWNLALGGINYRDVYIDSEGGEHRANGN
jgi:hypothetical protein